MPGRGLVEHRPEREQVAARVERAAEQLLGRHVVECAHHQRGPCEGDAGHFLGGGAQQFREPEIQHLDLATRREHDVAGLQVAMDDRLLVSGVEGVGDLCPQREDLGLGERSHRELLRQRRSWHELHH